MCLLQTSRPFLLPSPLSQTINITVGSSAATDHKHASLAMGIFVIVGANEPSGGRLLVFNATSTPKFAVVGNFSATGGLPWHMARRPLPSLAGRFLVAHGAVGGLWEYTIDAASGAIAPVGQKSSVQCTQVADSGSLVCVVVSTSTRSVQCFNTGWGLVATLVVPNTQHYGLSSVTGLNMPGMDYQVRHRVS
jgi:hypothetical protein